MTRLKLRQRARTITAHARYWWTRLIQPTLPLLVPAGSAAALTAIALFERLRTTWRRLRRARARVIWGPSAILNIKYWSEALSDLGYESVTCVDVPPSITSREDFDRVRADFLGDGLWSERLRSYAVFAWALRHGDVFMRFFDGGFLRYTPLERLEYPLTRLAGKKLIVVPYGGDIAVAGHLGEFEDVTLADYPDLPEHAELLKRRVLHSLRWANLSIRTLTLGFQPSYDAVCLNLLSIDTGLWPDVGSASDSRGRDGEVTVVHAPNHRAIKGTLYLEQAVAELREEGLNVNLEILEGRSNEEVHETVLRSDVVADQFLGGYGLFALEGMSAGKPVLGNLKMRWLPDEIQAAKARQGCPIVDSSPEELCDDLRRLVEDPALRRELGRAGREYVMRFHSNQAVGRDLAALVEHVWRRRPLPEHLRPPQRDASAAPNPSRP